MTGPAPEKSLGFGFGTQFFKNMVYGDALWDYHTFDPQRDGKKADEKMAHILNATDADLKPFAHHGGKLILYHGWSDAAIPPYNTIDYYNRVEAKLKPKETATFVRLYGAGHAALRRRAGAEQLRYERAARDVGGAGRAAGPGDRVQTGPHPAALSVPRSGALERQRQHRRCGEFLLRNAGRGGRKGEQGGV